MKTPVTLVLNAGSSSLKFSLFEMRQDALNAVFQGQVSGLGQPKGSFVVKDDHEVIHCKGLERPDHEQAIQALLAWIDEHNSHLEMVAVGHRVVHGGPRYQAPVLIDTPILEELQSYVPLAPLHQPHNLVLISLLKDRYPSLPQIACFDTAFHRQAPRVAQLFGLTEELEQEGVIRYGFHGLSYEYIAQQLVTLSPNAADKKFVVCHLGNGASMCAINRGVSVASTLGFTALDGLPMGTRSGSVDPGVLLYLMTEKKMSADEISNFLYKRSGLLGISGVSSDMRELLSSPYPRAKLAIEYFTYRINRELGSLVAALGGIDGLVFTGGIGENAAPIREQVCRLAQDWIGVSVDQSANNCHQQRIDHADSRIPVWVIPTNEELMIAEHVRDLLTEKPQQQTNVTPIRVA